MSRMIIHHANCFDGLAAARAARQNPDWAHVALVPAAYGDPKVPDVIGKDVLVVDFSYDRETVLRMAKLAKSFQIIDHHVTAEKELVGLEFAIFDMTRSGAGLTWDILHPGKPRPRAIDYIEDRDLWRHALPHAAAVQAWMRSYPTTLETIEYFVYELEDRVEYGFGTPVGFVQTGYSLLAYRALIIEEASKDTMPIKLLGYEGRAVNFGTNELYSEVAEKAGEGYDFGLAWKVQSNGRVLFSMRSREGSCDVSNIAKALGGGGHRQSSGANMPLDRAFMVLFQNDAWERGNRDAAMDLNENAPFGSVKGRARLTSSSDLLRSEWIRPHDISLGDRAAYQDGYAAGMSR